MGSDLFEVVWVLFNSPTIRVPIGVFTTLDQAISWIEGDAASYSVADYPVDIPLLDWVQRTDPVQVDPSERAAAAYVRQPVPVTSIVKVHPVPQDRVGYDRPLIWLWISYLPDRRPIPSAAFSSELAAATFVENAAGDGAVFRYVINTVPGTGGRVDFRKGMRQTPFDKDRLLENTKGELREILASLSQEDIAQAEEAALDLDNVIPLHRSWIRAYKRWQELVESVEEGYPGDNLLYDYQHQLSSRGILDRILRIIPHGATRSRLERSVQPLDTRFAAVTRGWPESMDPTGSGPWANRVPKVVWGRFAAELAERESPST